MSATDMTQQALRDTADTRMREAEWLLDPGGVRKDRRDGAVTCALLAVECALKVLVLRRYGADRISKLSEAVRSSIFAGKRGHDLAKLEQHIDAVGAFQPANVRNAIAELHQLDRYDFRYGHQRPKRTHAAPHVELARSVIDWMKDLTQ